jgi:predicted amidohydrolase YtcJ
VADFVVLADDPTKVNHLAIRNIPILKTYVGGKLAWHQGELMARGVADWEEDAD